METNTKIWNTGFYTGFNDLEFAIISNQLRSVSSVYEGNNFESCLTKLLIKVSVNENFSTLLDFAFFGFLA